MGSPMNHDILFYRKLHASEEVLSRSYGPSHMLRLSFRERKKRHQEEIQHRPHQPVVQHDQRKKYLEQQQQQQPHQPAYREQSKSPVTMESAPPIITNTRGICV